MFRLSIVTPEKVVLEADVISLTVPGTEGYLGVLTGHAPLITALQPGKIEFRDAQNRPRTLAVTAGFLEVSGDSATLLADAVEGLEEINIERAQAARERAWEQLKAASKGDKTVDTKAAREALARAVNRIRLYESTHNK
jgi:F-type H+-transporting ATPase subunit epsilon